jgi:hypothetical protein
LWIRAKGGAALGHHALGVAAISTAPIRKAIRVDLM